MVIYETLHEIFHEQRNIVDNGIDVLGLSSTLRALPRLTHVYMSFFDMIYEESAIVL
jgi:hypothetical protein